VTFIYDVGDVKSGNLIVESFRKLPTLKVYSTDLTELLQQWTGIGISQEGASRAHKGISSQYSLEKKTCPFMEPLEEPR